MNKSSTIQLVFVIIGIISFWEGLQYLTGNLIFLLLSLFEDSSGDYFSKTIFFSVLQCAAFFGLAYLLIKNSHKWSKWCAEKSELDNDFKIVASVSNIFYVLFLLIGTYALMKNIPFFLEKAYLSFASKASRSFSTNRVDSPSATSWLISFLNILLPLLLILLGRNIADYSSNKINKSEVIEITENKDSSSTDIL